MLLGEPDPMATMRLWEQQIRRRCLDLEIGLGMQCLKIFIQVENRR